MMTSNHFHRISKCYVMGEPLRLRGAVGPPGADKQSPAQDSTQLVVMLTTIHELLDMCRQAGMPLRLHPRRVVQASVWLERSKCSTLALRSF